MKWTGPINYGQHAKIGTVSGFIDELVYFHYQGHNRRYVITFRAGDQVTVYEEKGKQVNMITTMERISDLWVRYKKDMDAL